ncbi:MAG: GNAT family N-acetyltransferase [Bacteroidaceae bacterium]|nr:GNAT family N-acetyltransferase [Bacteroidaceae bacterium]
MQYEWLKNERMCLRSPEPEDLELLYRMENDTALWSVGNSTQPYSHHTLREYLITSKQDLYSERQARFVIELTNKESVGMIDIIEFDPHNLRAEVCIGILKEYRNQGIGKCALGLLMDYALRFLNLHQVYAYIPTENEASKKLFSGKGFVHTATLQQWKKTEKSYCDVMLFQHINE